MNDYIYEDEHKERVIEEILDDVDVYTASEAGPEGPWYYDSLTVRREMNDVFIYDVDGEMYDHLVIPDLSDHPDPHRALQKKLDNVNDESLAEL